MQTGKNILVGAAITFIFYVVLELILAFAGVKPYLETEDPFVGFSKNIPLFVEKNLGNGRVVLTTAENKKSHFNTQTFNKTKAPNTYRIFCLGGSTTYGRPYTDNMSFSGWLRHFLPAADPAKKWEIINAGGISYASYRVVAVMKELLQYEPDLFVVYSGHNEFLEERTYRKLEEMPVLVSKLNEILAQTRLYSVIKSTLDTKKTGTPKDKSRYILESEVSEILNKSIGPTAYSRNDRLREQIIQHYQKNLKLMVDLAKNAGSEIILVTPVANLKDMSPFKSENAPGLAAEQKKRWETYYNDGLAQYSRGAVKEALASFQNALHIDNRHADLNYMLGKVLFDLKRYDQAKVSFQHAIDEDIAPLRILPEMVQLVIDTATENDAHLINFEQKLESAYRKEFGQPIFGKEYFPDHVHLNYQGYRMIALTILDKLAEIGVVEKNRRWGEGQIDQITKRLEGNFDTKSHALSLANLGRVLLWAGKLDEAYELFNQSYTLHPNNETLFLLANCLMSMGKEQQALERYEKILQDDPNNEAVLQKIAQFRRGSGSLDESVAYYQNILSINPDNALAHNDIALAFWEMGKFDEALKHLNKALALDPNSFSYRRNLALLLSDFGYTQDAIEQYEILLKSRPNDEDFLINLGILLAQAGQMQQAESRLLSAIHLNNNSASAHYNLALLYGRLGRIKEAEMHFRKVISLNKNDADAYYYLGRILQENNKLEEARFYLSEAEKIKQREKQ